MIVKNEEKREKSTVSFDVVCDAEEFEKAVDAAYRENRSRIFIPGFRKGKAPRMVIEGMYGKDVFYEDAADELAPDAFSFGVQELSLRHVGTPSLRDVDFGGGQELTLSFLTAVWPEVTLGEYKGVEAPKAVVDVSEEQVSRKIEQTRKRNGRIVTVDRPAQDGDTVVIDYKGTIDGEPFEGSEAEDHSLLLGSNSFIPGFEEQLIGMSTEEEKDIFVTFPDDYEEKSLAGKPAVFHIHCHEIKEVQLPDLDDEFAKDVSEYDTFDEYKASVRAELESNQSKNNETAFQNALLKKAADNITVEIPDAMIEEQLDSIMRQCEQSLNYNGISLEAYLQYSGEDMSSFRQQFRSTAENQVRVDLLLDKVAEVEDIEVTEEEIEAEYQDMADELDADLQIVKDSFTRESVVSSLKSKRAEELIFSTGIPTQLAPEEETGETDAEGAAKADAAALAEDNVEELPLESNF